MASPGNTPKWKNDLLQAVFSGNLSRIKKMAGKVVNSGNSVHEVTDELGIPLLHIASAQGATDVCKFFIEDLKYDINLKDRQDCTPLHHATLGRNFSTAVYLLKKNANPNIRNMIGIAPIHYAAELGHEALLHSLLSRGANVDVPSDYGTPLQRAAEEGKHAAVKILLDHHANANLSSGNHSTSLLSSITAKSLQCVELLLKAGADPNISEDGVTPLEVAASQGNAEMIRCLIKAGADPNVINDDGLTPIEALALKGNHQAVQLLFPVTSKIPTYSNWSFGGIMKHVDSEEARVQRKLRVKTKFSDSKLKGEEAFRKKDYPSAISWYSKAITVEPSDATLLSNRSLCYARMGVGPSALSDAIDCIKLKPDWSKAHYRAGAAWNIMERFDLAAKCFFVGLKLDPENRELLYAYQEARSRSNNE